MLDKIVAMQQRHSQLIKSDHAGTRTPTGRFVIFYPIQLDDTVMVNFE